MKRWPKLAAGGAVFLALGFLYAWSVFSIYFKTKFGWSASQLAMNFTLFQILFSLGVFTGGLLKKKKPGRILLISAVIVLAGLYLSSVSAENGSLWLLYISFGCVTGYGLGLSYLPALTACSDWYPERRGSVSGLLIAFMGLGTVTIGKIAEILADSFGLVWALRGSGLILAIVLGLSSVIIVPPVCLDGKQSEIGCKGTKTADAVRTASFWLFFAWNVCISSSGLIVMNRAANIALWYGVATVIGMLASAANSVGRLTFGALTDAITARRSMLLCGIGITVAGILMLCGVLADISALIFAGMLLTGFAFGGSFTLRVTVLTERFGAEYIGGIYGIANFATIPAALIGPYVSGLMIDSESGAYTGTFIMVSVLGSIGLLLDAAFRTVSKKEKKYD